MDAAALQYVLLMTRAAHYLAGSKLLSPKRPFLYMILLYTLYFKCVCLDHYVQEHTSTVYAAGASCNDRLCNINHNYNTQRCSLFRTEWYIRTGIFQGWLWADAGGPGRGWAGPGPPARPGSSFFYMMDRGPARPIKFSEDGPWPGPAHYILKNSPPGPARPIIFSKV